MDDLPLFLNLLARSGTGQKLTTYTHLFHGPAPGKKLYVIFLDNGRTQGPAGPGGLAVDVLHPLRGLPERLPGLSPRGRLVLRLGLSRPDRLGAHAAPGGHGKAGKLPFASSLCGACGEVCPVKIDIPHQLVHLRHRAVNEPSPMNRACERLTWKLWAWAMGGPRRYGLAMWGVRLGVRMAKYLPWHPGQAGRLDPRPRVAQGPAPFLPQLVADGQKGKSGWAE